eukprot:GHVQ01042396.1.p1 GENE.GHVQ01042396.1~~GHVQ01042396.1.p1  ORF type:complete len:151 (-),score=16.78 GHVQ01042396.1:258-710(-)
MVVYLTIILGLSQMQDDSIRTDHHQDHHKKNTEKKLCIQCPSLNIKFWWKLIIARGSRHYAVRQKQTRQASSRIGVQQTRYGRDMREINYMGYGTEREYGISRHSEHDRGRQITAPDEHSDRQCSFHTHNGFLQDKELNKQTKLTNHGKL